jgi:hypothetical protein
MVFLQFNRRENDILRLFVVKHYWLSQQTWESKGQQMREEESRVMRPLSPFIEEERGNVLFILHSGDDIYKNDIRGPSGVRIYKDVTKGYK